MHIFMGLELKMSSTSGQEEPLPSTKEIHTCKKDLTHP